MTEPNATSYQDFSTLGLIAIRGNDAKKFLQGQLTCHMDEISNEFSLAAHCNPQGRVISLFQIMLIAETYYLQMPRTLIPIAIQALKKYAVFYKVTISDESEQAKSIGIIIPIDWKKRNIQAGIPAIYAATSEKFLPHEINLHQLNAISFNKGCYTGQEIIARMHYRGKLKKHMYHAHAVTALQLQPGADIFVEKKPAGTIVDCVEVSYNHYEMLVIADETDAENQTLTFSNDEKLTLTI